MLSVACLARFEVGGRETGSETTTGTSDADDEGEGGSESGTSDEGECNCDPMLEICVAHECVCRFDFTPCGGTCVDLQSDPMHCGECGDVCTVGVCDEGNCETEGCQETTECDGMCVDLERSALHCGSCDHACAGDELCIEGECVGYQPSNCRSDLDCEAGVCCSVEEDDKLCIEVDACP